MKQRALGESGIQASVVGFGAWAIGGWMWGGSEERESIAAIHAALDNGITLIDTAPVYGFGLSEEIIGRALKGGRRHQAVLATKCSLVWDCPAAGRYFHFDSTPDGKAQPGEAISKKIYRDNRPAAVRKGVEDSLRRLQTDYVDLIQTHWQDPHTSVGETMAELLRLKKEGKVRAIGCSNATAEQLEEYRAAGQLDSDQEKYSMLDREMEEGNLPYCAEHKVAFLAYSPLAQGLLTGKIGPERVFEPGDQRLRNPRFRLENRERVAAFLGRIRHIADDYRITLGQLVTAWTIAQPGCTHALLGARTGRQAAENAGAGAAELAGEAVRFITRAVDEHLRLKTEE